MPIVPAPLYSIPVSTAQKRSMHIHPLFRHILAFLFAMQLAVVSQVLQAEEDSAPDDKDEKSLTVEIVEPFVNMHTAPGRGYPIFHVAEQGDEITVLKRKTNWYKVKTASGTSGWVKSKELAHTLGPSGIPVDLPEINHGDYLKSLWRAGFTAGQLEGAAAYSLLLGFRPFAHVGLEGEYGEVFDNSATGNYYGGNVIFEPVPSWKITPFLTIGTGRMNFEKRQTLAGETIEEARYTNYGGGLHFYVGRNFVIRGEYKWYSVSAPLEDVRLNELRIGFYAFF